MLMNRVSPLQLVNEMRSTFDLLNNLTGPNRPNFAPASYPAINAWTEEEKFYVEAEIPGMSFEDLEIFVTEGRILTIKGQRSECKPENGKWLGRERGCGPFERRIQLPGLVDQENVEATLKNGVLTVALPKAPQFRARRIEVKTA
jgi:HSP20 family protein